MNETEDKDLSLKNVSRSKKLFAETPIWKSLLIMAVPSMIMMLVFGLYTFTDNVMAIDLANHKYDGLSNDLNKLGMGFSLSSKDLVRLFMSGLMPITTFIMAITLLFSVGISRRFSINIGSGNRARAIKLIETTMWISLCLAFILIPILLFTSRLWIESEFGGDPRIAKIIADNSYDYVWIIVITIPLQMFNQLIASLLRAEARNKQMLLAIVIPIFVNLFFNYVFMGLINMNIQGGAIATAISYVLTTLILCFFISRNKNTLIKFHILFGLNKFNWVLIIGVFLVGISPFMRNMTQSITQTIEQREIQEVSQAVYGNPIITSSIMSAVFPIFGLFFPVLFSFVQAGSPIIAYNYGAKNMKKVKRAVMLVSAYTTIAAVFLFVLSTFVLMGPLMSILGIRDQTIAPGKVLPNGAVDPGGLINIRDKSRILYGIMFLSSISFGFAIAAMTQFGSTDRLLLSIFASTLRGITLFFPFIYGFASIATNHPGDMIANRYGSNGPFNQEFLFWWFYPSIVLAASLILLPFMIVSMRRLKVKHLTLDDRIDKIYNKLKRKNPKVKNNEQ